MNVEPATNRRQYRRAMLQARIRGFLLQFIWILAMATGGCSRAATAPTAYVTRAPSAPVATAPNTPASVAPSADAVEKPSELARFITEEARRRNAERERVARETEQALRGRVKAARQRRPAEPNQLALAQGMLARWLLDQRRYSEARLTLEDALLLVGRGSLESDQPAFELQMILADLYRHEGAPHLERVPLRTAVDLAARHPAAFGAQLPEVVERLVHALESSGGHSQVVGVFDRLLKVPGLAGPALQWVRLYRAGRYARSGDWERAVATLGPDQVMRRRLTTPDMTYSNMATAGRDGAPPDSRDIESAGRDFSRLRWDFRSCFVDAFATKPKPSGAMRVTIRVTAAGSASEVHALSFGLPVDIVDCVLLRASQATFSELEGGGVIAIPVTLAVR